VAADPQAANGRRLYLRPLDRLEAEPVAGAEAAHAPFFSPDGEWLAFFTTTEGALRKVPLSGGPPLLLTRGLANPAWINGSWSQDGSLVFHGSDQSLRVLPEAGARPTC
jgi:hypothetical protein